MTKATSPLVRFAAACLICLPAFAIHAQNDAGEAPATELKSDKEKGILIIAPDPVLSDDRLVLRIVAGILQSVSIAPSAADGGQVVSEPLKFGRKEARALHIAVVFNGETHEFDLAAPPGK